MWASGNVRFNGFLVISKGPPFADTFVRIIFARMEL